MAGAEMRRICGNTSRHEKAASGAAFMGSRYR
jgi:hypothetical protein